MTTIFRLSMSKVHLLPRLKEYNITHEYIDSNGHLNTKWYWTMFVESVWKLFDLFGMDEAYQSKNNCGCVAFRHTTDFLNEVMEDQSVSLFARLIERSKSGKRLHYMLFMMNETTNSLAAIMEGNTAFMDRTVRKVKPFPPEILANIDRMIQEQNNEGWEPPLSGAVDLDSSPRTIELTP